jgi:outer membrane cobalamin receptor
MGRSRTTFLLALGATLLAADTSAAERPRPKSEAGATVTVTAEAEEVDVAKSPNPIVVVDKEAMDRLAPRTIAELLQQYFPGQVMTSGGVGTAASFFLGGARSQDVVVTLDGIRLEDPMGLSGVALNTTSLTGVDRVEIQQGACSSRQGANALGGVVALYSAGSAPAGFSGSVDLGAGSRASRRASLAPAYGWGSGWFRVNAALSQEDQAIAGKHPYRTAGTSLGLGQQLGEASLLTANYLNAYAATPIPFDSWSYATTPRQPSDFKAQRETATRSEVFSTTLRSEMTADLASAFTVGGWEQERMDPDPFDAIGLPTTRYASRGSQFTEALTWSPAKTCGLTGTLDLTKEWGISPDYADSTIVNVGRGRHTSFGLEGFLEPFERLRFTAATRQQEDQLEIQPGGNGVASARDSSAATYKLGANLQLTAGFRVYVSGGTSYAHPGLYQLLFNLSNQGPALGNEKSYTLQTGTTWEQGPWKARLGLSRTRFEHLVYYDPSLGLTIHDPYFGDYQTGAYQNGANIRIQSAEVGLGYLTTRWGLEGFYRNQEARDLDQPEGHQLSASTVIRRPFQSLGASVYWILGGLRLDGRWSWFGSRYEYGLPFAYKAHFNDLSLSAAYAVRKNLTVTLRGEHLLQPRLTREDWLSRRHDFDNDAAMQYGLPAQPPTVALDVKYRF